MTFSVTDSRWRALAVDLDGTLIGWDHKIHDRDLDALRRARAAGFHVAVCTGRNSRESAGVLRALDLPAPAGLGVFVNGGMVCHMHDGRAAHSTPLPDPLVDDAIAFLGSRGHAVLVLADDPASRLPIYCLTDHGPPHRATTDWLLYNRVTAQPVSDPPPVFRGTTVRLGTVVNVDQAADLHAAVRAAFGPRAATHSIYSPHYDCQIVELFHPDVNKWTGLVHLAGAAGFRPDQIITIGDDINDIAMLENARLSFAMGSALPAIQGCAKRVTAGQKDCGVSQVIDQLLAAELERA
jgi:Cof subfamily protein (haloacid dehalogenase superfamily)